MRRSALALLLGISLCASSSAVADRHVRRNARISGQSGSQRPRGLPDAVPLRARISGRCVQCLGKLVQSVFGGTPVNTAPADASPLQRAFESSPPDSARERNPR
jgi:hypothetical protein